MFIMKKLILLAYFFRVCLCGEASADFDDAAPYLVEVKEEPAIPNESDSGILNATLFKSIKSYYCRTQVNVEEELLLFGTKAWMFPSQNVKLTFQYPSRNQGNSTDRADYLLTSLLAIFHLSGADSKGFITSGGMLQDHISTTFMFRNITSLSYQFVLHGVPSYFFNVTENHNVRLNLC